MSLPRHVPRLLHRARRLLGLPGGLAEELSRQEIGRAAKAVLELHEGLIGERAAARHETYQGAALGAYLLWWWPQTYVKVRDRTSYEFALASAAVAVDVHRGVVRDARIAVGGVGTRPWRLQAVEAALRGRPATEDSYLEAAKLAVVGAKPLADNAFKLPLVQRTIARALAGAR